MKYRKIPKNWLERIWFWLRPQSVEIVEVKSISANYYRLSHGPDFSYFSKSELDANYERIPDGSLEAPYKNYSEALDAVKNNPDSGVVFVDQDAK